RRRSYRGAGMGKPLVVALVLGVLSVAAPSSGQPPSACCLPNGPCQELTGAECDAAGGSGLSTDSCVDVTCVGCCLVEGQPCQDNISLPDCEAMAPFQISL